MALEIAVAGANGFTGRHVTRALKETRACHVVELVRRSHNLQPSGFDLRDRSSITAVLGWPSVVVHAASYVGRDAEAALAANVEGTRNLLTVARERGVRRFVYVSTAAVYGRGPFRGLTEEQSVVAPSSLLSTTRAAAEQAVLEEGGIVVRPHLVLGAGDRWVLPTVARLLSTLGTHIDNGVALHSAVHVQELGKAVAWLATQPDIEPGPYHVGASAPITAREFSVWAEAAGLLKPTEGSVSLGKAHGILSGDQSLKSSATLLGIDHVFDVQRLERAGYRGAVAQTALGEADLAWYRS